MKRLWTIVIELYHDGYRGMTGAVGAIFTGVASCELQDRILGDCSWNDDFDCLDG